MTRDERTIVSMARNDAKRAWLEQQGGYEVVEKDAQNQERKIARACGDKTRAELEAENAELRRLLHLAYNRVSAARKSRDVWYRRATGHEPGKGRGGSRNAIVNSQSTSDVG